MFELLFPKLKWVGLSIACTVVATCVLQPSLFAQPHPGLIASAQEPSGSRMTEAVPSEQTCQARVNDTPEKLLECIQQSSLWNHLAHFQKIADEHKGSDGHGNRDTGTAGYKASVDYVAGLVRQAGYKVTVQQYQYNASEVTGVPEFGTPDQSYAFTNDWLVAQRSGGGTLTASIQPAGGSFEGCFPGDFARFVPGQIALLERGTCAYDVQVANAEKAGAAAVILYGSGNASPFPVRLTRAAKIPVVSVSNAVGSELLTLNPPTVHLDIRMRPTSGIDYNLIAESPFGDTNHVVVVDAHLDSIYGAGMLDNASGSTTILEIALNMAKTPTRNQLRYIWFGGEEIGLFGSAYYTTHLSSAERKRIAFDIDMDVTATLNFDMWIADPANASDVGQFPPNVVPQSKIGNKFFADFFNSIGVVSQSASFGNDGTDSNSFALIGIPDSGILTRQDCCKEQSEVAIWGGFLGNYEGTVPGNDGGCVDYPERWCDNLSNNDPFILELASKASAYVTLKMANHVFKAGQP
jgi:Zn-dependent M28 family amino/carboxypeptidase